MQDKNSKVGLKQTDVFGLHWIQLQFSMCKLNANFQLN